MSKNVDILHFLHADYATKIISRVIWGVQMETHDSEWKWVICQSA